MAKKRRKPKAKQRAKRVPKPKPIRIREHELRPMIREAARTGLVEAIEHSHNFWSVGEGYKKYIDYQVKSQAEALMAAVKTAIRDELSRSILHSTRRKR